MLNKIKRAFTFLKKNNASNLHAGRPLVILDIGCRWGFADKFISDMNNILIFGFDPDKEECNRLEKSYNNDSIRLIPIALADKLGNRTLFLTKEPGCSSLYKPDTNLTKNYPALDCATEVAQIEVELSTLDIWAKDNSVNYIDYIKIDTQGAELSILKGASKILSSVRYLEIEVEFNPIYEGQPIFSDVDFFLRKFGFVLWKLSNLVHYAKEGESELVLSNDSINYDHHKLEYQTRGGQIYWADAFYIRSEIVDVLYDKQSIKQIKRDSELAYRLGFLDIKKRLDIELKNREIN